MKTKLSPLPDFSWVNKRNRNVMLGISEAWEVWFKVPGGRFTRRAAEAPTLKEAKAKAREFFATQPLPVD